MTPAERLRAMADETEAAARVRAASLRALADELERGSDAMLTLDEAKEHARVSSSRVISDAARRGELMIEHAGRKPLVRRRELERWMRTRATARTVVKIDDDREDARADHRAAAQRLEREAERVERARRRTL